MLSHYNQSLKKEFTGEYHTDSEFLRAAQALELEIAMKCISRSQISERTQKLPNSS